LAIQSIDQFKVGYAIEKDALQFCNIRLVIQ